MRTNENLGRREYLLIGVFGYTVCLQCHLISALQEIKFCNHLKNKHKPAYFTEKVI